MRHLCKELLNDSQQSKEIFNLWQEYEDGLSNESKFVKDLDKFEMIVQAFEYEQCNCLFICFVIYCVYVLKMTMI